MNPSRVLIAGCGDVGNALGVLLLADGASVYGMRRDVARLAPGIVPLAADLADLSSFDAPENLDAVVYAAAPDRGDDTAYLAAYVNGQRNLLDALARGGVTPSRWLFASSTGVYAQSQGEWVDEDSPAEAATFSGRRLREGEELAAAAASGAVSVRFGGIYGPGRNWLIETVRGGGACRAEPPLYTNRIHRDDCAGVLRHLLQIEQPAPVYVAVDCEPASQCEVMDWLGERLGVPQPPRVTGGIGLARGSKRCRNTRLLESGYVFRYPGYREGYAAVLDAAAAG